MLRRDLHRNLAALLTGGAIALAGCGASTERGADRFYREHATEALRIATAMRAVSSAVDGLPAKPSPSQLEALAIAEHRTRRDLLAAAQWTLLENGEEEGVSQAEREINEGTGALLNAMKDLRLYAQSLRPADLAAYRLERKSGREYWNQGITELWYVGHKTAPPKF